MPNSQNDKLLLLEKELVDLKQLVTDLQTNALNSTESNTVVGAAKDAVDEYIKITESLKGFPDGDTEEVDPRWKIPPVSLRADT